MDCINHNNNIVSECRCGKSLPKIKHCNYELAQNIISKNKSMYNTVYRSLYRNCYYLELNRTKKSIPNEAKEWLIILLTKLPAYIVIQFLEKEHYTIGNLVTEMPKSSLFLVILREQIRMNNTFFHYLSSKLYCDQASHRLPTSVCQKHIHCCNSLSFYPNDILL